MVQVQKRWGVDRDEIDPRATQFEHSVRITSRDDVDHFAPGVSECSGGDPGPESGPDDTDPHLASRRSSLSWRWGHRSHRVSRQSDHGGLSSGFDCILATSTESSPSLTAGICAQIFMDRHFDDAGDGAGVPMSDTSQGPGWWLASDGKWYPPQPQEATPAEVVQSVQPSQTAPAPAGAVSPQGPGWWEASDGLWYPPTSQPQNATPAEVVPSAEPSQTTAQAPIGAAGPRGPGWWEASDGAWYPPELHPDYKAADLQAGAPAIVSAIPTRSPMVDKMSPTIWVMLAGGALVIIGSLTTWVTASLGPFSVSGNGISGDGKITLVLAILAIGAVLLELQNARPAFSIATLVLFGLLTILSILEFVHISSESYSTDGITIGASVGFGLYLCLAGSIAGVAAWIIERRRSRQVTT